MNAIETHALEKKFRGKRALRDLNLTVGRGEIYGFIGKNGSGKSTTMKIVAGLMPATAGEVHVLGAALAPCEAHPAVGTLIESPGIYPSLSAYDNRGSRRHGPSEGQALLHGYEAAPRHRARPHG